MSWWESASGFSSSGFTASGFTNLATAALKTAQKRIDKVLDIKEEENQESTYQPELVTDQSTEQSAGNDGFFGSWDNSSAGDTSDGSMFLSKDEPLSPNLTTETISLKDKLEKKRAARAANMAKKNASFAATKIKQPSSNENTETINEKRAQDLGQHPQSAFTVVRKSVSDDAEIPPDDSIGSTEVPPDSEKLTRLIDDKNESISDTGDVSACEVEVNTESEMTGEEPVGVTVTEDVNNESESVTADVSEHIKCEEDNDGNDNDCCDDNEPDEVTPTISLEMTETDDMQGSGWNDVSLSLITDSTFSSKCPSDADLIAMATDKQSSPNLDSSWEQTMESSTATVGSLEVVKVEDEDSVTVCDEGKDSDNAEADEVAQCGESVLNEFETEEHGIATSDPVQDTTDVRPELSAPESSQEESVIPSEDNEAKANIDKADTNKGDISTEEETGGWDNEELDLKVEEEEEEEEEAPIDEAFLSQDHRERLNIEETSSTSGTMDSLSESNRTITAEDMDRPCDEIAEEKVGDELTSSTSSYVKNMLEEAMNESMKDTDSHTSSEMVRIESAQNSGHTSADEVDTTTSSDIEIISHISTPTPNGDGHRIDRPFDLSPLRHALSRSVRRGSPPGHKRSDSSSSGHSYQSRSGEDLLSPDGHLIREHDQGTSEGASNPLETEKLLKKLAEVSEVLDAREKKLFQLSQENVDLVENNTILRNQLQQAEEAREAEMEDLNALTEEFTQRIADTERTLQNALREKEAIKKKLRDAESELIKRADNQVSERLLKEKEQVISELLEEGEKLSKQQLQSNNIIKKLRTKEKDSETTTKQLRQKIEEQAAEVSRLESILENKVDNEKAQGEVINKLNSAVKTQESEILRLTSDLEDSQERCRSMKSTLDSSYKEITELHKAKATHASESQKAALSAEMQLKEELRAALDDAQSFARRQQEALVNQIEDLQLGLSRMENEHGRREDVLRREISDLQLRLQEAENRNQELTANVTAATRPLLRQIENLQSTYTAQSDSYEKVERNLTDRLGDAQSQLAAAIEKERLGSERILESTMKVATMESQLSSLRQEKSRLQAQLEMERTKAELLEEASSSDSAQMEALLSSKDSEIVELKREKLMVENLLETEKGKVDSEKKKLALVHEQLRDKELAIHQMQSRPSITPPGQHSREGSTAGGWQPDSPMSTSLLSLASSMNLSMGEEALEKSLIMASSTNGNKISLYDSLRSSNATALVENLQAQLKQREGEITQLQNDIGELEKTREAMARELVNLSTDKEDLQGQVVDLTKVQKNFVDLDQRYQALLQMYGEKVEEVQELRLDLQDIKEMYKAQINELLMSK